MKSIILTMILAFLIIHARAQAPNWAWAKGAGSMDWENGRRITNDAFGNAYVMGWFDGPSITFGTTILTNHGGTDIFIAKYDVNGSLIWAKSIGGLDDDYAYGSTSDDSGNVYITGQYGSDSITFGATTLTNNSFFIVKYDNMGNLQWAHDCLGTYSGHSITTDASGNIYATGTFTASSITFGTTTLINSNSGDQDIFIVKYNAMGNVIWAKGIGGTGYDITAGSTTDAAGNLYVTGGYYSPFITIGTTTLTNADTVTITSDMFIVKYDSVGNLLWVKGAGGTKIDSGRDINTDAFGNLYVTGQFYSPTITFGTSLLTNVGGMGYSLAMFIVKYDASGNLIWALCVDDIEGYSSTDVNGNLYLTCRSASPTITFGTFTLSNAGYSDIYVVKFDSSGNVVWVQSAGGTGNDAPYGVSNDVLGNVFVIGNYNSPSLSFGSTALTNMGNYDVFIAKLDASIVDLEKNITDNGISIYPNPTKGIFTISNTNSSIKSCIIYNILGEYVFSQKSDLTKQINLDLSAQAKGIYFVETTDENWNVSNTKIIIQ
jgi:hypothetical protein